MSVLTVCNHKGGTGKTTTSIHLAAALGHSGKRVLVVDLDPQGFLTRMIGAEEPAPEHSSLGLLDPTADLAAFPVYHASGFDLVGSSMGLTRALRQLNKPTDVLWLRETLAAPGVNDLYDAVVLDTAAALTVYTMNALVASDVVLVPVTPEYQPVVGAEQTWQTCGLVRSKLNPRLAEPRFLLTQVDARLNRHARYAAYMREKYGDAVLATPIRTSSSLATSSRDGRTVFDARTATRGASDYEAAAREIYAYLESTAPSAPAPETRASAAPTSESSPPAAPTSEGTAPAAPTSEVPASEASTPEVPGETGEAPVAVPAAGWTSLDRI